MVTLRTIGLLAASFGILGTVARAAPPLTTLYSFTGGADGGNPSTSLVQDKNGFLYGVTAAGGIGGRGTVFGISPAKSLQIYTFPLMGNDGANSMASLLQSRDGNLFGAAQRGGANGTGTLFKVTPFGEVSVLYTFSAATYSTTLEAFVNAEGSNPRGGLIQDAHGDLYGTASSSGVNGEGTVFKLSPSGSLSVLHSFNGDDGANPFASLTLGSGSSLYGTTYGGGVSGLGTIFTISPEDVLTTLYSFGGIPDGAQPYAGLLQAQDGSLYGTASIGGAYGAGTIFMISPDGTFTTLHSFSAVDASGHNTEGAFPHAGLIEGRDGSLYGTASSGGANGSGTVFSISSAGVFTTLYTFSAIGLRLTNSDGASPAAALLQGRDGNLYGTTATGGASRVGTIFKLTMTPVVSGFAPASGPVGTSLTVTGANFTGTTAVTIGGVPASFALVSDTSLTLTVPAGAPNRRIVVNNPFGKGQSSARFIVTP